MESLHFEDLYFHCSLAQEVFSRFPLNVSDDVLVFLLLVSLSLPLVLVFADFEGDLLLGESSLSLPPFHVLR